MEYKFILVSPWLLKRPARRVFQEWCFTKSWSGCRGLEERVRCFPVSVYQGYRSYRGVSENRGP